MVVIVAAVVVVVVAIEVIMLDVQTVIKAALLYSNIITAFIIARTVQSCSDFLRLISMPIYVRINGLGGYLCTIHAAPGWKYRDLKQEVVNTLDFEARSFFSCMATLNFSVRNS